MTNTNDNAGGTLAVCATRSVADGIAQAYPIQFDSIRYSPVRFDSTRRGVSESSQIGNPESLESSRVVIGSRSKLCATKSTDHITVFTGDKLRQKHMHTSNYGHNGVPSVSRYAAALHKQRSRLHLGVLGVLTAKSWGATTDLGRDKGAQGPRYLADTHYVGKDLQPCHLFQLSVSVSVFPMPKPATNDRTNALNTLSYLTSLSHKFRNLNDHKKCSQTGDIISRASTRYKSSTEVWTIQIFTITALCLYIKFCCSVIRYS